MTTSSRSYQGRTTSALATETSVDRLRRNGISPALATSSESRAAVPAPAPPPTTLRGAVKVDAFPSRSPYPFREIAGDGGIWRIDPAEYKVKPESIRSSAWTWAKKEGLTVKVVIDGGAVFVQFTGGGDR